MTSELMGANFARRADEILGLIQSMRTAVGLDEAINAVYDRYVDMEPRPELKRLGEVLALARRQAVIQTQLDNDREALHHGHLRHEEHVSTGHHYEMLRHQACIYNHLLRGLVEACSPYFSRDELMGWLVSASSGRAGWAKAELTGVLSEVALHAALQGLPELRGLRYATVEEDLVGYDYVANWQGSMITIDSKTGNYPPLAERKHGHRHLEISVPREVVRDLRINHRGLALLRREVRQVLARDAGVDIHPPHHYFQPLPA